MLQMDQATRSVFAIVKQMGGRTYAVYDPNNEREFEQTCDLVERSRVHNNGPADYRENLRPLFGSSKNPRNLSRND